MRFLFTPFMYWKLTEAGLPLLLSVILAVVGIGAAIGAVNGSSSPTSGSRRSWPRWAMLFFLDGLTLIISHSEQISTPGTSVVHVGTFAQVFGGGTYSELIWAVGIAVVLQIVLSFTRWGLYTVATGGNRAGRRGGRNQHPLGDPS